MGGTAILNGRLIEGADTILIRLSGGENADKGDKGAAADEDDDEEAPLHHPCSLRLETGLTLISAV